MLQDYWASTVIFIGVFSQCTEYCRNCEKYFQSFIAIDICQILKNILLQHYNFNILEYFCKHINI